MKNQTLWALLLLIALSSGSVIAQEMEGIATYNYQRKVEMSLDSTQLSQDQQKILMSKLKKQFERIYTLSFLQNKSLYQEEETLDGPSVGTGGMQMVMVTSGGNSILFNDMDAKKYVNQTDMFGKQFLIQDAIVPRKWKLTKESKSIGAYTCFKATYKDTVLADRTIIRSRENAASEEEQEPETEIREVVVWYTPQIPLPLGPENYTGLPGLVLEVNNGNETILCSKIVLNPKNDVVVKAPKGGKKVNQAEYDAIEEKKMQEMNDRFRDSSRDGEGTFRMRIGG